MISCRRLLAPLFFLGLFILGLMILRDYGFATDEHINRENGGVSLQYILSIIENITGEKISWGRNTLSEFHSNLLTYKDRDYGVAFDLPAMIIERLFHIDTSQNQYLLRHALTHFIFLGGLWAFYLIIKNRFNSQKFALVGAIFLVCSPRIYAESFYNNKDIIFLSLFIIALFFILSTLKNPTIKNLLFAALFTALAINVRIVGVILPLILIGSFMVLHLKQGLALRRVLALLSLYFISTLLLIFCLWPWLWTDPIGHFIEAFRNMAKFRWLNWVLYRGHYYPSSNLPWHYLPIWVAITTPPAYLILSTVGVVSILITRLRNRVWSWISDSNLTDLIFVSILFVPTAATIIFRPTMYDGWRQFYFIYPSIIYMAVCGFVTIERLVKQSRTFSAVVTCAALVYAGTVATWMMRYHPFQNVYFNFLAGRDWINSFEGDYWGLSNTQGLKFILNHDARRTINIFGLGNTSIPQALLILPEDMRTRIVVVDSANAADYVITNFRLLNRADDASLLDSISRHFSRIYFIEIDNNTILAVYKMANRF
jgi:hypothetical protein